jgi:hypothetical protein
MAWPFYSEKSTYHKTIVHRVYAQLKRSGCSADFERSLVPGRVTDTFGYSGKKKTWYFCEIKVNWPDLQKAVTQIHEQVYNFKRSNQYMDKGGNIVPIIAIPNSLYTYLMKYYAHQWNSYCSLCKTNNIVLWVVEQSAIRQIQGPKPKKPAKVKAATKAKTSTKAKSAAKPMTPTKANSAGKRKTTRKPSASIKTKRKQQRQIY